MNKYRAWSPVENKMYYPDKDKNVEWTIDDETGFIAPQINLGRGMWGMLDKYILMQSTGLKDKNGVEIFEGDVVINKEKRIITYGKQRYDGVVDYIGFNVFVKWNEQSKAQVEYEVIGNIHANPELLKESK